MPFSLDMLRDPEEQALQQKLSDCLAADTILTLMKNIAGNTAHSASLTAHTRITQAVPDIDNLVADIFKRLKLDYNKIPCYLSTDGQQNACCQVSYSAQGKSKCIVISNRLFDQLPEDEIRAAIAHEAAHLYYGHYRLAICIDWLDLKNKQGRSYALGNLYRYWQKLAELSADRATLLAVDNPANSIKFLARRSLGNAADSLEIKTFLKEQKEKLQSGHMTIARDTPHPPWEFRILALEIFRQSSFFQIIQQNSRQPTVFPPELAGLTEYLKVSPNQRQFAEFCFLLTAGNYLINADHHIHKAEIDLLRDILARLIHIPNRKMLHDSMPCNEQSIEELGEIVTTSCPERRHPIFELLSTLVVQDGRITREEQEALNLMGQALDLKEDEIARIILKIIRQEFHPALDN